MSELQIFGEELSPDQGLHAECFGRLYKHISKYFGVHNMYSPLQRRVDRLERSQVSAQRAS